VILAQASSTAHFDWINGRIAKEKQKIEAQQKRRRRQSRESMEIETGQTLQKMEEELEAAQPDEVLELRLYLVKRLFQGLRIWVDKIMRSKGEDSDDEDRESDDEEERERRQKKRELNKKIQESNSQNEREAAKRSSLEILGCLTKYFDEILKEVEGKNEGGLGEEPCVRITGALQLLELWVLDQTVCSPPLFPLLGLHQPQPCILPAPSLDEPPPPLLSSPPSPPPMLSLPSPKALSTPAPSPFLLPCLLQPPNFVKPYSGFYLPPKFFLTVFFRFLFFLDVEDHRSR
jgi:hypothetical protein